MAYFYRIGTAVLLGLAALLLLLPGVSEAATEYRVVSSPGSDWGSKAVACASFVARYNSGTTTSVRSVSATDPDCEYMNTVVSSGSVFGPFTAGYESRTVADPDPTPTAEDANCDAQAALTNSTFGGADSRLAGNVSSGPVCNTTAGAPAGRGCKATFTKDIAYTDANGQLWSYGRVVPMQGGAGLGCTGGSTAPTTSTTAPASPTAEISKCKGQPGMVNGVEVCVPFGAAPGTTVSEKQSSGTSTPAGGSPTATTTNQKTTCTGNVCTTETTTSTSVGGGSATTSTSTGTQGRGEYCAANPRAAECGGTGAGSFGGSCAAGFSCDGDALMCAIAKQQHVRNCELFEKTNAESDLYDENKVKTGNQNGSETVTISSASFDQSNALGVAASCMPDLAITVAGSAVSLPFSTLCSYMQYLGYLNLAISFLLAIRIVTRG